MSREKYVIVSSYSLRVKTSDYRTDLIQLAERLGVTDEMAGEEFWQQYLTVSQIEEATLRLYRDHVNRECRIIAGVGGNRECGILESFCDGMAIVRWDQGTVTQCPVAFIEEAE